MRDRGSPDPIIAYHGTPHSFDQFDTAKIGKGEGNQAFGTGLYFAGHSPVSEWYRHQLAARFDTRALKRAGLTSEDGSRIGVDLANSKGDPTPVIRDLQDYIAENKARQASGDTSMATKNMIDRSERYIKYLQDPKRASGHMYEVAIDRPQEHFLDWDKALSGQSDYVKQRMAPMLEREMERRQRARDEALRLAKARLEELKTWKAGQSTLAVQQAKIDQLSKPLQPIGDIAGQKLYEMSGMPAANPTEGYPKSAERLRARGIAGIRYLDNHSRTNPGARGTSNYVTFDAPRMLRRYAVPGMIGAGGFGALAAPPEER